ncbi:MULTISPECIES: nuclear transport factor 2 family protein [Streptomyces]|uniref:Nuclear transport factor 2 family protein n=2 Tax=Streptomyces TaxID=1883 RepID=A0ABU2RCH8_9ACTN|nr:MULTISPECIES: nuclear transport factor 2 family protein [unclassified Streptomyces]MBK3593800.1 nuclear transport factor 2 family protein [Streptomyces sp. MBT51]MDT0426577.1 nuclear transport factor 2 family protein [Streptomyces sp. DSM 41770]
MPASTSSISSARQIENLIARYSHLVDDGDFAEFGALFENAEFVSGDVSLRGGKAIEDLISSMLVVHDDGTLRTRHITTNILIEVNEDDDSAEARSYYNILQAVPGLLPLQMVAGGRYRDRFERREGTWSFARREVTIDFTGDTRYHLKAPQDA